MAPSRLLVAAAAAPWRPLRVAAAGADLARSTGVRYAWQRWREEGRRARLGTEPQEAAYRRIWSEAAAALGAELREPEPGRFEVSAGAVTVRLERRRVPIDPDAALSAAFDKPRHYALLRAAGVPVPEHLEYGPATFSRAEEFRAARGQPCVVKPARDTGGGSGVTTGVRSQEDLARATLRAARGTAELLVEPGCPGEVYRVLVLDGEILDVIRRRPPRVIGNGRDTVAELIRSENRRRMAADPLERARLLKVDLDSVIALRDQGLRLSSVPAAGQVVIVKRVTNQNAARDNETVRGPLAEALREELLAAVAATGLRLAGVDVVTPDLTRPLAEAGGAVIEVNGDPALRHHYAVADPGRATRVAIPVLRRALEDAGWREAARRSTPSRS